MSLIKRIYPMAFAAVALASATYVSAATQPREGALAEFNVMDLDNDGKLSPEEHTAGAQKMFETMDADKNDIVTAAEMDAAQQQISGNKAAQRGKSASEKIKVVDINGDGVLSGQEHAAGSKKMFERMDTDNDGFLSKAEVAAGHAKMMRKETK